MKDGWASSNLCPAGKVGLLDVIRSEVGGLLDIMRS